MTELSDEQQATEDLGDSTKQSKSHSGFWFNIIILLVVLGLAAGGFYSIQTLQNQQKDLGNVVETDVKEEMLKQLNDYQSQLTAIQSQVAHTAEKIDSKDEHFAKSLEMMAQTNHEQMDNARKELNESVDKIELQLNKTRGYWLLADAEYLLSVANERLNLIGDVHTTIEALEAADRRLEESGDAGVIKVREKISEEITVLKTINLPDIVGTYMAIQSLQEHVGQLNVLLPFAGKTPSPSTKSDEQTETITENKGFFDTLGVKHSEQNINAIITPEQAIFIREQLRVKLEMVKIALTQHNEDLYQSALKDTKNWLEHNFTNDKVSLQFSEELEKIASMKLRSQFPDINQSLKLLGDIGKARIESDKLEPAQKKPTPITNKTTVESKPLSVDAVAPKPAPETSAVDAVAPKPAPETSAVDAVAPKPAPETSAVDAVAPKPAPETSAVDAVAPKPAPENSAVNAVAPKPTPETSAVDAVAPKPTPEKPAVENKKRSSPAEAVSTKPQVKKPR